jgi:TPP-dependent pyruvate/acetoin dehydrogenase alpha subunit
LAKGASVEAMLAEFFGLSNGLARGLGGSMHLIDMEHHNAGSSAVVGSGVPIATGMALQLKRAGSSNLVVAFFGDGASSRGAVHEAMNMASVLNLPVLFLCEHNMYGMSTCAKRMVSIYSIADRGASYGIESAMVDGNDVEIVYSAVQEAARYIRNNRKPYLLETRTYRFSGHSKNDPKSYRTREEEKKWLERDPILLLKRKLIDRGHLIEEEFNLMKKTMEDEMDAIAGKMQSDRHELDIAAAAAYVYTAEAL